MNVSPNLSPSIKIMKPYFLLSIFCYFLSMIWLFFINPFADLKSFEVIGWVHLYMIGFVMLGIFSAMAQLGPVVAETKHFNVKVFKYIWIVLLLGLGLMLFGFYKDIIYLLSGGFFVLTAMSIYAVEFLLTLKSANRKTTITKAMKMSNFFLLLGILSGLLMALGFNGFINLDPNIVLNVHTFGLVVGFVILLIMGISIILIPMFGTAKRLSDNEFSSSFFTLSLGVIVMMLSPLFLTFYMQSLSYIITVTAILIYIFQLFKMLSSRTKRVEDIWTKSMYVGFSSFILSFLLLVSFLFSANELILKLGMWILLVGFFGFLIIGNFYKIIPFLVWFQIYSPLIEERAVPMLHELISEKQGNIQWLFSTFGLLISSVGILTDNSVIFYSGVISLTIGSLVFFVTINKVLKTNL